jgi:restriction endonuclease S subunit
VEGNRFDPSFVYKKDYLNNIKSKYQFVCLKNIICKEPQYGANEESIDGNSQQDLRYIRITDIDELGNLKQNTWKTATHIDSKYLLSKNDILFARSGSVGKCYIHKDNSPAIFAGYLIRMTLNKDINPNYLFYYCNSKLYWHWVNTIQRPAVQLNINSEEYKSLRIPLPPIEIQNHITQNISNIRQKAKQLQEEAKSILENAKQQVEKMIIES